MGKAKSRWGLAAVLLCVTVLVIIALPWIQRARADQRLQECAITLHNQGIGIANYVDVNGVLPRAEGAHSNGIFVLIMPYVETHTWGQRNFENIAGPEFSTWSDPRAPVGSGATWWSNAEAWNLSQTFDARFICPAVDREILEAPRSVTSIRYSSDGVVHLNALNSRLPGLCTYAGSAGVTGYTGVDVIGEYRGDWMQGVFGGGEESLPVMAILDGTSNTLAIGEYLGGYDQSNKQWSVRGSWFAAQNVSSGETPAAALEQAHWAYFSGPHAGQTLFAMLDDSVRSVSHDIDRETFRALCGIRDGLSVDIESAAPLVDTGR